MATVTQLRTGLATRLGTISGLRAAAFMPDRISVPQAIVGEVEIDFDKTFGNQVDEYTFKVRVYASRATDRAGQKALDGYIVAAGASSIKAAIEGDRTLGGVAETLRVESVTGYGVYEVGDALYLGAEFDVTVHARRS